MVAAVGVFAAFQGVAHPPPQPVARTNASPPVATAAPAAPTQAYTSVPVLAPSNPDTLYQLAQTSASGTQAVPERSTDGGASWHSFSLPGQGINGSAPSLFVSPADAERVFVTLAGKLVQKRCVLEPAVGGNSTRSSGYTPCSVQFVSRDGGAHWTPLQLPLPGSLTDTAAFHLVAGDTFPSIFTLEAQEQRLYAALVSWYPGATGARLVTSTDGGLIWQLADTGLASDGRQVCDFAPAPTGATVFALTAPDCVHGGTTPLLLWQSADAGAHWTQTSQFVGNADLGMAVVSGGGGAQPLLYMDVLSPASSGCAASASSAFGPQSGICGGAPTDVRVSADGGRTWHAAPAQGYPDPERTPGSPLGVLTDGSVLFLVDDQFFAWRSGDAAWHPVGVLAHSVEYVLLTSTSAGQQTLWVVTATATMDSTTYAFQQYLL